MKKHIRNSVKAIIIENGKLLVLSKKDGEGIYRVLPGGGQKKNETLPQSLQRECLEEIGAEVQIGDLFFVRDYISEHHEFWNPEQPIHQVEFFFECHLPENYIPGAGISPDPGQYAVSWVGLDELRNAHLYPRALAKWLCRLNDPERPVYLGDVN